MYGLLMGKGSGMLGRESRSAFETKHADSLRLATSSIWTGLTIGLRNSYASEFFNSHVGLTVPEAVEVEMSVSDLQQQVSFLGWPRRKSTSSTLPQKWARASFGHSFNCL